MIEIQYTLPANRDEWFIKGTVQHIYFEVPGVFNDDGSPKLPDIDKLARQSAINILIQHRTQQYFTNPEDAIKGLQDEVYVGQKLVRTDATLWYDQTVEPLRLLWENWPTGYDFESSKSNVVGLYDGYREPYTNQSISWYEFKLPSPELRQQYGAAGYLDHDVLNWYGLKFDLVTKDVLFKIVLRDVDTVKPPLPEGFKFYARIHDKDGTVDPLIDCYVSTISDEMRAYCAEHNVEFPVPDDIADRVILWGIVYDERTLEIKYVKGYFEYGDDPGR